MNDLFGGDERYEELLARIDALEAVVYQRAPNQRLQADEPLNEAWQKWNRYRNGKGWTAEAKKLSMNRLRELAGTDGKLALAIVDQAIEAGWRALYPIRQPTSSTLSFGERGLAPQRHKTVAQALAPTETQEEAQRAWEQQQKRLGLM